MCFLGRWLHAEGVAIDGVRNRYYNRGAAFNMSSGNQKEEVT